MISSRTTALYAAISLLALGVLAFVVIYVTRGTEVDQARQEAAVLSALVRSPFMYTFNSYGVLRESGNIQESVSPYWWLDSGGLMLIQSGVGSTIHGGLPEDDKWRRAYARSNPVDTDGGYHPQNIFRLVTRSLWKNFRQEVYFRINADNLSKSPNRNASNGILLLNRYQDADNLYYAGIRVDGNAVIKKKQNGVYHVLSQQPFIVRGLYDRTANPNLLPHNMWVGVRTEVIDVGTNQVLIRLFADIGRTGVWQLVAEAVDNGTTWGPAIMNKGSGGMRTDFMDVDFSDYQIEETP